MVNTKIVRGDKGRIVGVVGIHGMRRTRFYNIWGKMNSRCSNPKADNYRFYGGRGIKVLWKDFLSFKSDMYTSYLEHSAKFGEKNTSIDRIDSNGDYKPLNCRWSVKKLQARNMRSNRIIEFQGLSLCLSDWSERLGFKTGTIQNRLSNLGWSIERALTEPAYYGKNQFSKII